MIGVRKVDDPRSFGVAEIDCDAHITHLVEKPHIPKSNMALVGVYKIRETEMLFQCLEANIKQGIKTHGEYSITDALDCMIQMGAQFNAFKVDSWFDCGRRESLLESNATLLKKFGTRAVMSPEYENTVLIQPVSIGKGCTIKNSIVGPNATIGDHTIIDFSIIKNSIIGSYSNLFDIVLDDSLIGSDTTIRGETRTLNIGDNTDINQQLEVVKSMDFEKIEADIKKIKPDIEKSMKDARRSIEKAKVELKAYKNFIEELDRDGLINKKETYKIEYRNGELIVNGKKQPAEVANKYKNFLNGRKDFTIKKEDDGFNIENE